MSTRDYLVIDLEATCDDRGAVPKREMEIIEIGAVMVSAETLHPLAEFQSFVRPRRHPTLTAFCSRLTSISQADVDAAPLFPEVLESLRGWAYGYSAFCFGSWGDYDRAQLHSDCRHHGVRYPLGTAHLNIKKAFSEAIGSTKRFGMGAALTRVGLTLEGTHHRGIDDARNIARLLPWALGRNGG